MNKSAIAILAMLLMVASAMAVPAPSWTLDKVAVVTGDWKWDNGWTKPAPAPITAAYSFQATGNEIVDYSEVEYLGQAWKYGMNNLLTSQGSGFASTIAKITTVNDPRTTPGVAFTDFRVMSNNFGEFTHSEINIAGTGFANVYAKSYFASPFTSQNFVCINDCVTTE